MLSSPRRAGNDGASSSNKRGRRNTSDIPSPPKEGKRWSLAAFATSRKPSNPDPSTFPGSLPTFIDPVVVNDLHQLHKYTVKIRSATKNVNHVDSAWNDYHKYKEKCFECCKTLIAPPAQKRESSVISPTTIMPPRLEHQRDDSLNLMAVDSNSSTQSSGSRIDSSLHPGPHDEQCQKAVREWEATVELLTNTLRSSLQETYNTYEKDATPEGFEKLCTDKATRYNTIYYMRNASISKMMSADLDFFNKYDVRFRNYDEIKKDLAKLKLLLGTSSIPQSRTIIERRISPTGDVMLEFANKESESYPVYRFRVSSHCLRETTSPIFGLMFNPHFRAELDDDIQRSLPPPPDRYACNDGHEIMRYRMPQTELNTERSLEILLHAAHNHNERVPREVQFNQFVAIAEACLRYRCTSPLELAVEHMWLPYWRDKATNDMLAEVLLICYVFGLTENFARLSRIVILNMPGLDYVQRKPRWPQRVEEKIAAVRHAKCRETLNEYLFPTPRADSIFNSDRSQINPSSGLRCPKGDRTCDAQNLGWYMKSLTELGLLPTILSSPALLQTPAPPQSQSLLEIISRLSRITGPPQIHGGICDFAPAFRAAIKDIYESVPGLTLFEVSGKSGWALSKNRSPRHSTQSQKNGAQFSGTREQLFKIAALQRDAPGDYYHYRSLLLPFGSDSGSANDNDVCFKIMNLLDDPRDLRAAALIDKRFYRSYLRNKSRLWENIRGFGNGKAPEAYHHMEIAEVDGTPSTARISDDDENYILRSTMGAVPPQEKFRHGQLLLIENKRLVAEDGNKYTSDMRKGLLGITGHESDSQRSYLGE
ncbi:hypothetical protein FHL15_000649 [Xylaria flabelliformis]|uniref:Uncharacterized protein n=1 Tax=Xylaria flabelliformis TaxID=2512241 RepID=A0A553IEF2_9PEZI|nr:hypothetical protein FHL15_000649 [Xylaria flabelliformis]